MHPLQQRFGQFKNNKAYHPLAGENDLLIDKESIAHNYSQACSLDNGCDFELHHARADLFREM